MLFMNGIIIFYILQRLSEILISRSNEKWLREQFHATEVSPNESYFMIIMHGLWFLGLILELNVKKNFATGPTALALVTCLVICLLIRYHTIDVLKRFWTIKVMKMECQIYIRKGIYKYFKHPNYFVVLLEFILLPWLLGAFYTMLIFSVINTWFLYNRIKIERSLFMPQFIKTLAFIFVFIIGVISSSKIFATELQHKKETYKDAKASDQFICFESESTKLGFITTKFDGMVKSFTLHYDFSDGKEIKNIVLYIDSNSLDTDLKARNDKMINEILDAKNNPQIKVELSSDVPAESGDYEKEMIFTIKNVKLKKLVKFKIERIERISEKKIELKISGNTIIGLKESSIPDPSIMIAKVRDHFDLSFSFLLSLSAN